MENYFQGTFYNSEKLTPIVLFVYNRPEHTRKTLEALSQNTLAEKSKLFVFADGAKENATQEMLAKIAETRAVVKEKNWCGSVTIFEQEKNRGLAASIISGVTEIANQYGSVIVLEDDIVTGKYFLEYMNNALELYKDEKKVWHITAFRAPIKHTKSNSAFFYPTMDCWGWATWADRWQYFKKDAEYYKSIFTPQMIYEFNVEGTDTGMWAQIEQNISGQINTWAIFWYATIFLQKGLCLSPTKSLVRNIGFDNTGVHCGSSPMLEISYTTDLKITNFQSAIKINRNEFDKNKKFKVMMHNKPSFKLLKKILKKLGLFDIAKRTYHKINNT